MTIIFEQILRALHVPFTKNYTREMYMQHPDRNNLLGISRLLNAYGVDNVSVLVSDKKALTKLEPPFLAEFSQDLAVVTSTTSENVEFIWRNEKLRLDVARFQESWSGVVTLLKKSDGAQEPFYRQHHRKQMVQYAKTGLFVFISFVLLVCGWFSKSELLAWSDIVLLGLNGLGCIVSWLLIRQGAYYGSEMLDRICSSFTKANCHKVLDSQAASILGYHWSEIGLAFFATNLVLMSFCPKEITDCLSWIVVASIPFTVWSIWTQAKRIGKWCVLCLAVVAILWLQVAICAISGKYGLCLFVGSSWVLPCGCLFALLVIHWVVGIWTKNRGITDLRYKLNSFLGDASVLEVKLHEEMKYNWDDSMHPVVLSEGVDGKPTITVISNPYCNPCARMHKRLEQLRLHGFRIQYVLTSFNESLFETNKKILAFAQSHSESECWDFLNDWFMSGRDDSEAFWSHHSFEITDNASRMAMLHKAWCDENGLNSTPTILINNQKLPELYKVEDLLQIYDL